MSGTRLLTTTKNHVTDLLRMMSVTFLVFLGLTVAIAVANAIWQGNGQATGLDLGFLLISLATGVSYCASWLKCSLANGVSRNTELLSVLLTSVAAGILVIAADFAMEGICQVLLGEYVSGFELDWGSMGFSAVSGLLFRLAYDFLGGMELLLFGYWIAALWYRMNKTLRVISVALAIVILLFAAPIGIAFLAEMINAGTAPGWIVFLFRLSAWFSNTIEGWFVSAGIELVFCAGFAFLLIRRAPAKGK